MHTDCDYVIVYNVQGMENIVHFLPQKFVGDESSSNFQSWQVACQKKTHFCMLREQLKSLLETSCPTYMMQKYLQPTTGLRVLSTSC